MRKETKDRKEKLTAEEPGSGEKRRARAKEREFQLRSENRKRNKKKELCRRFFLWT